MSYPAVVFFPAADVTNSPDGGRAWPTSIPSKSALDPQHSTEPSGLTPQVWKSPALMETNSPPHHTGQNKNLHTESLPPSVDTLNLARLLDICRNAQCQGWWSPIAPLTPIPTGIFSKLIRMPYPHMVVLHIAR